MTTPPSTWADHLQSIADLIDKGHDGTGREPLTILDDEVVGLIQDVDWREIAGYLRRLAYVVTKPVRVYTVAQTIDGDATPFVQVFRTRDAAIAGMKELARQNADGLDDAELDVMSSDWCFLIDQLPDDGGTVVVGDQDVSLTLAVTDLED